MRIPKGLYHIKSNILFIIGLVLFVFFFAIIYTPDYGLSEEAISINDIVSSESVIMLWYKHQALCLPICCAIILLCVSLSRTLLILITRTSRLREGDYFWWQLAEVTATALFINLFISLLLHHRFFVLLPSTMLIYLSVCIYPYAFYWLLMERVDRDLRIAEAHRTIEQLRKNSEEEGHNIMRFTDTVGTVRLVVSCESILYIEAAGNYVTVLYLNSGKLIRYGLRNTLKGIEHLCEGTPLVRCHRSYYINLSHIRLLRKNPDGLIAEIDTEGVEGIPISKTYASEVMERFSKQG